MKKGKHFRRRKKERKGEETFWKENKERKGEETFWKEKWKGKERKHFGRRNGKERKGKETFYREEGRKENKKGRKSLQGVSQRCSRFSGLQCWSTLESRISLTLYSDSPSICSSSGSGCCQRGNGLGHAGSSCDTWKTRWMEWNWCGRQGDRVGAWFSYHVIWAQVLFQEFLGWPPGSEELCLDIGLVTNF